MEKWEKVTFANPTVSGAHLIRRIIGLEKYKNVDLFKWYQKHKQTDFWRLKTDFWRCSFARHSFYFAHVKQQQWKTPGMILDTFKWAVAVLITLLRAVLRLQKCLQ